MAVNLVLMGFGDTLENHYQAAFSILSFMKDQRLGRVLVVTDRPDYYRFLGDRLEIIPVDAQTLQDWQGPHRFFWRIKIKAIEAAAARLAGQPLLYIDSDTFLATDLADIEHQLGKGNALMHLFEDRLGDRSSSTLARMHDSLKGRTLAGFNIGDDSAMWNAGVIGLPGDTAGSLIARSLALCDAMCATSCPRRLIEQFAFSVVLQQGATLVACDQAIGHYWGNKPEWNAFIARFWAEARLRNDDLDACIEAVRKIDWQALPLEKRSRRSIERLRHGIEKLFNSSKTRYFPARSFK